MQICNSRFVQVGVLIFVTIAPALSAQTLTFPQLNGAYSFQVTRARTNSWSSSITCYHTNGTAYTVAAGGFDVTDEMITGGMIFEGNGNVVGVYSDVGIFDQAASNATAIPSCSGQSVNGYAVYDPPANGSMEGTYSIVGAVGLVSIRPSGAADFKVFSIALTGRAGSPAIYHTVFMYALATKTPNKLTWFGMAVRDW